MGKGTIQSRGMACGWRKRGEAYAGVWVCAGVSWRLTVMRERTFSFCMRMWGLHTRMQIDTTVLGCVSAKVCMCVSMSVPACACMRTNVYYLCLPTFVHMYVEGMSIVISMTADTHSPDHTHTLPMSSKSTSFSKPGPRILVCSAYKRSWRGLGKGGVGAYVV